MELSSKPGLRRELGLIQATSLAITDMVGIGPYITIPLFLATMGGPQAMLGWLVGALLAFCDGLVWAELGAAMPKAGGSYNYLREAYGARSAGRWFSFLMVWQIMFSAPLSVASGSIGFGERGSECDFPPGNLSGPTPPASPCHRRRKRWRFAPRPIHPKPGFDVRRWTCRPTATAAWAAPSGGNRLRRGGQHPGIARSCPHRLSYRQCARKIAGPATFSSKPVLTVVQLAPGILIHAPMSPHHRSFNLAVRFVRGHEQFIPIGCAERGEINGQTVLVGKRQRDFGDFRRHFKRGLPHLKKRGCLRCRRLFVEFGQLHVPGWIAAGRISWFEPTSAAAVLAAVAGAGDDLGFITLDAEAFARATAKSIDYAVMERTTRAAVIPVSYSWSDVGSWNAVWELSEHDADGNAAHGKAVFLDTRDSYVTSDRQLVALYGVDNLIVAATDDAVLVARRDDGDGLRRLVKRLKEVAPAVTEEHLKVHRPWGSYQSVDQGNRFQVKRIVVKPGGRLSLQLHHHRAEHWIVVRGTARVTIGEEIKIVHENEFDLYSEWRSAPSRKSG